MQGRMKLLADNNPPDAHLSAESIDQTVLSKLKDGLKQFADRKQTEQELSNLRKKHNKTDKDITVCFERFDVVFF